MFVCDSCLKKHFTNAPSLARSRGRCEVCERRDQACSDIPSYALQNKPPEKKKPRKKKAKPQPKTIDSLAGADVMRHTKEIDSPHMREETAAKLYSALQKKYPGKVWRVIEVCPVAVVKTIDNERDALETLRRLKEGGIEP